MSFRRILLGLLTLSLALMGLAFGALFVICLSLYLLWHGLNASIIVFGGLCTGCIILVQVILRRAPTRDNSKLPAHDAALLPEEFRSILPDLSSAGGARDKLRRRKML
jgi:hypothetical protein